MKKEMHIIVTIAILFALALYSPHSIAASKSKEKVEYAVENYKSIKLDGNADITYEQKEGQGAYVRIECNKGVMDHFEVVVKDETLIIRLKDNEKKRNYKKKLTIYTNSQKLSGVNISGAGNFTSKEITTDVIHVKLGGYGNIKIASLKAESVNINIEGKGNATIAGKVAKGQFSLSGMGNINTEELELDEAKCNISGIGKIHLQVKNKLTSSVSGLGKVRYKGNPTIVDASSSGLGSTKKIK